MWRVPQGTFRNTRATGECCSRKVSLTKPFAGWHQDDQVWEGCNPVSPRAKGARHADPAATSRSGPGWAPAVVVVRRARMRTARHTDAASVPTSRARSLQGHRHATCEGACSALNWNLVRIRRLTVRVQLSRPAGHGRIADSFTHTGRYKSRPSPRPLPTQSSERMFESVGLGVRSLIQLGYITAHHGELW